VIDFQIEQAEVIKFVGRWFDVNRMRFSNPTPTIGPILLTIDPDGASRLGCPIASPYANARHALLLTCEAIPNLGPEPEMFLFFGGFDPETMADPTKEAGFLAFLYPLSEAEKISERLGTVDYIPKPKSEGPDTEGLDARKLNMEPRESPRSDKTDRR
jgi:hypothetical protein